MAFLTIHPSSGKRFQIPFDRDVIRVGRSSKNEIHLALDPSLSRVHAEFTRAGGEFYVADAGSRNGTVLNGEQVARPTALRAGDRVTVGETVIVFTPERESAVEITDDGHVLNTGQNTVVMPLGEIITSPTPKLQATPPSGERTSPQGRAFAILSRAANEMLSHRPLDETLEVVMDMVFEATNPDRGVVMLLEGDPPALRSHVIREGRGRGGGGIQISRAIAQAVIGSQQSVLTSDIMSDERFASRESIQIQGIQSAMCAPLWNNKEVIGLIYVDSLGAPGRFQRDDLRLLTLLANLAAIKVENIRLFEREQKMMQMERELETAAQIQRRLLPTGAPDLAGYEMTGYNLPCREVGGDYYDFLPCGDGRMGIVIGDVSGKGMGAALLMATLQASFRAHAGLGLSPPDLVARLNQTVAAASMSNKFISFFYGELNAANGELRYVNAGHNPPLLLRTTGEVERLRAGGMILGVMGDSTYTDRIVEIRPGDLLVLFSDGITESQNEAGEEFGEERLIEVMRAAVSGNAESIRDQVESAVDAFVGKAPQFDDITLTVLKRNA